MTVEEIVFYLFVILGAIQVLILYFLIRTFFKIEIWVYDIHKKVDYLLEAYQKKKKKK